MEKVTHFRRQYQVYGKSPGRFKFKLLEEYNFSGIVSADIFYFEGDHLLHGIDELTCYQAARFLTDLLASTVWNTFRISLIDVYLGPPYYVIHDKGTNFLPKKFRQNTKYMGI